MQYISGTQRGRFSAEAPVAQRVTVFRGDRTSLMHLGQPPVESTLPPSPTSADQYLKAHYNIQPSTLPQHRRSFALRLLKCAHRARGCVVGTPSMMPGYTGHVPGEWWGREEKEGCFREVDPLCPREDAAVHGGGNVL